MINKIKKKLDKLPTIMSIQEEIDLIGDLMKLTFIDIKNNEDLFIQIIDALDTSHMDAIYEVNKDNYSFFNDFAIWLEEIRDNKSCLSFKLKTYLNSTVGTMRSKLF